MSVWLPVGVWIGAVVLAILVFAFCGYELLWRSRRLTDDLARLGSLQDRVRGVQAELAAAQERVALAQRTLTDTSGR